MVDPNPQQPMPGFDMAALLAALRPQPQPQMDLASIIRELHAPRQQSHLGIGGAPITNDNPMGNVGGDPFSNGFFKPANFHGPVIDPAAQMATRHNISGMAGMLPMTTPQSQGHQVGDPFNEAGGVLPGIDPNHLAPFQQGYTPVGQGMNPAMGQGMINPHLPGQLGGPKFQDANFWHALAQSTLPQGVVMGDGKTNYRRPKAPYSPASAH